MAGQVYTLQCGNVNATWKYNGTDVTNDANTFISNGNLTFKPLLTSHGGKYSCVSGNTSDYNVTVQSKGPTLLCYVVNLCTDGSVNCIQLI